MAKAIELEGLSHYDVKIKKFVVGEDSDISSDNTIKGAKAYADSLVAITSQDIDAMFEQISEGA